MRLRHMFFASGWRLLRFAAAMLLSACSSQVSLPPKAVELNTLGAEALHAGDLEAAGARLNLAIEYNPEFVEAVTNLGLVELQRGNLARARQLLERAKRLNPDLAQSHHGLGVLAQREFQRDEAQQHYQAALSVDPGFVPARANLATLFLEAGLFEDALVQFGRLVELAPNSALGPRGLSEALLSLRRYAEAESVISRALFEFPGDPSLEICMARLLLHSGELVSAENLLRPIAAGSDDHAAEALGWLSVTLLTAGDAKASASAAKRALGLVPDHPLASYAFAVSLDVLASPHAKEWLIHASRLNPQNDELRARLARK
jgi:tetratricopeptide (TPR) repeat protein